MARFEIQDLDFSQPTMQDVRGGRRGKRKRRPKVSVSAATAASVDVSTSYFIDLKNLRAGGSASGAAAGAAAGAASLNGKTLAAVNVATSART